MYSIGLGISIQVFIFITSVLAKGGIKEVCGSGLAVYMVQVSSASPVVIGTLHCSMSRMFHFVFRSNGAGEQHQPRGLVEHVHDSESKKNNFDLAAMFLPGWHLFRENPPS